jgi:hypothetical protein
VRRGDRLCTAGCRLLASAFARADIMIDVAGAGDSGWQHAHAMCIRIAFAMHRRPKRSAICRSVRESAAQDIDPLHLVPICAGSMALTAQMLA